VGYAVRKLMSCAGRQDPERRQASRASSEATYGQGPHRPAEAARPRRRIDRV